MSFLNMSDEEFLKSGGLPPEPEQVSEETAAEPAESVDEPVTVEDESQSGAEPVQEAESTDTSEEADEEAEEEAEQPVEAQKSAKLDDVDESTQEQPASANTGKKDPVKAQDAPTLPDDVNRIFDTFRASGRDMKVKSVDEVIRLMQMGANYSQKRAEDKQKLGYVKVLEKNGLLDHEKLGYLIDLHNKNPEAIGKLIKDSGVDVHDLDDKAVEQYRAQSRAPNEAELELDDVLSDIKTGKNYQRLVESVGQWDQRSQAALGNSPKILAQLAEQMDSGVYDTIMDEVHRRRVLGTLGSKPLLQEYDEVGIEMAQAGHFNKPAPTAPVKKLVTPGKKQQAADPAAEQRRRAAAPTKASTVVNEAPVVNSYLKMSDEDFLKQASTR